MKRISLVLMLFLCFAAVNTLTAQSVRELPSDTIAVVGSEVINAVDFLERFELFPWMGKELKNRIETTKLEFLHSLIAEKLLSYEAASQNLGQDSVSVRLQRSSEHLFVRDELYREEVQKPAKPSPEEVHAALKKFAWECKVEVLTLRSEETGNILRKILVSSLRTDSVLQMNKGSLYFTRDTLTANFGMAEQGIENAVYGLKPFEFSKPYPSSSLGWVILRVVEKYSNTKYISSAMAERVMHVEKILQTRREDGVAKKVFGTILGPQKAAADVDLFALLADSVHSILITDSTGHRKQNVFYFSSQDIDRLQSSFSAYRLHRFATFDEGGMTMEEVIDNLQYNRVVFPSLKKSVVEAVLNNNIKTVIQNELISRNALKKNYQQSPKVRHDVAVWTDSRKSRILLQKILDTILVGEKEVINFYKNRRNEYSVKVQIRVQEILSDSLELVNSLRLRITAGDDFADLAATYSQRNEWKKNGGISEFFDVTEYGDIGVYGSTAQIGELIGPLIVPEGFTLFKVLERKELRDSADVSFAEVKKQIEGRLFRMKREAALNRYIGGLAKKNNVKVFENNLKKVYATTTNMATWRTIGFGGKIIAVPQVIPQYKWVDEWKKIEVTP